MESPTRWRASRNVIALTVLALLLERPRHPYEMQRLMRERHKDFAIGKTRSFYDAVDRLVRHGLVEAGETSREGHHPERTVYRITDEGRTELESWLHDLLSTPVTEYPLFNVALNFLGCLSPEVVLHALEERSVALQAAKAGLDAVLIALQEQRHLPRLVLIELEHTRALHQAEAAWVGSVIEDIQAGRLSWDLQHLDRSGAAGDGERPQPDAGAPTDPLVSDISANP
jgi:DNA-binding PadR family transcriptional regulator